MDKIYCTLDVYIASWILLTTSVYPKLICHDGRVAFNFPLTEKITQAINKYHAGEKIEAISYTTTIKNLKSQIFQLKEQAKKV